MILKTKDIIKTSIITMIMILLFIIVGLFNRNYNYAQNYYQVYLNGEKIGLIADENELYNLINEEQQDIKNTYNVSSVYPPNGFVTEKYQTYDEDITNVKNVYDKIKDADDFTIEGYIVKIKSDSEDKEDITLYVLNKDIFEEALKNVVTSFVEKNEFAAYLNNNQEEIKDVGQIIEQMYFKETITTRLAHISVHEKIYTDPIELSQFLLFGSDKEENSYVVQEGDTIESISEANKLNPQEFLIANPKFKDKSSILAIGDKVNITLIKPVLTLVEDLHVVEDVEQAYETETIYDNTKESSYNEVTQEGITGIVRYTRKKQVVNGEEGQGADPISTVTIRETQNEITTKGGVKPKTYTYNPNNITGSYVDTGQDWGWPTNRPYIITSEFQWRWGSFHNAIDISGTGFGSPIYAAKDGTVVETNNNCPNNGYYASQCGGTYGNYIVIQHANGIYTMYAHLIKNLNVNVGDTVTKGQIIASMGNSGSSTGSHLHFGVSVGEPNQPGSSWMNPWRLYK